VLVWLLRAIERSTPFYYCQCSAGCQGFWGGFWGMLLILLGSKGCDWFLGDSGSDLDWLPIGFPIGLGRIGALTSFGSRFLASELSPGRPIRPVLARTTTRRSAAFGGCPLPRERRERGG
jgi:hypothetical protein